MATMSGFQAVNAALPTDSHLKARAHEVTTPTTPRPVSSSDSHTPQHSTADESSPNTPTRDSFGGLSGQRPLPAGPVTPQRGEGRPSDNGALSRESSQRSIHSRDSQDIDMDESDEDQDGSDDESIAGESGRPSKKKKGQRFFCTDFPPCTLSFTRSEHLARHIRKHTGERPFQCHCARRFSRLDNLRQHAQTVHVNEEIPTDSLAATGTRFQRQVRTDRVRTPGSRSRASTVGSQSGHSRGHSRNLSSSSIGSNVSGVSVRDDIRRRPPPLIMANEHSSRARLSADTFRSPPDSPGNRELLYRAYSGQSPAGLSTPTSATFSTGPTSPRFPSGMQSPPSTTQRPHSMWDPRTHQRRLSVPSGANPFQSPHGGAQPPAYFSPLASSHGSAFSGNSSMYGSPTGSVFSTNREFASRAAQDAEFKRRTWHPESRSTFNSPLAKNPLTYSQTTTSRPPFLHSSSSGMGTRLPGIESFDQVPNRPSTPPRRGPSPMQIDSMQGGPPYPGSADRGQSGLNDRRAVPEWDMSLHRNLTRLDITTSTPPREPTTWPQQPQPQPQPQPPPDPTPSQHLPVVHHPMAQPPPPSGNIVQQTARPAPQQNEPATRSPQTPRKNKRHGWYNGPIHAQRDAAPQRTSPEDSSSSDGVPTPSTSSVGECNPSIVHSNGWVESNSGLSTETHQTYAPGNSHNESGSSTAAVSQPEAPKGEGDMVRLEALVAVATSEEKTADKPF
ncbi:MAG: hypothetical protein M1832_005935 [Thelocarpon impressellum]|nr:MAG: hypothetical protein M1832_005935 [Thelocarpon impressellum]